MDKIIGFSDLKIGQRVKVKGNPAEGGRFMAVEIGVKPPDEAASIEGKIQGVEPQQSILRIMHREVALTNGVEILNLQRNNIGLKDLKVGEFVKLKGAYSATGGFVPHKIKIQEPRGLAIEELQGGINNIDFATQALEVLGFTVEVNEKTEIEGF